MPAPPTSEDEVAPAKKIKLVISDFHLSRGKWLPDGRRNPLEDFHQDEKFRELLDHYSSGPYALADVELVVNGDFFDPLAVIPLPDPTKPGGRKYEFPIEVEERAAVDQFRTIVEGHPVSFQALRVFLTRGKRVILRWGNHDAAMLWPQVQEYLRAVLSPPRPEQLSFQVEPYVFDRICIDHGNQYEALNQFDTKNLFITRKTRTGEKKILNLPFGSFFILGFLNPIKLRRHFINMVQPFRVYLRLSLLLEPSFFFWNGTRAIWFFVKMRFITHPMRFSRFRKTLRLIVEVFYRPSLEDAAENVFTSSGEALPYDTLILGHNHQATVRVFPGGRQYINTGTWTPITSLDMATLGHRILRTYALIEYVDGRARATLKIWHGKPQVADDFA